jgi:hypothetical protein
MVKKLRRVGSWFRAGDRPPLLCIVRRRSWVGRRFQGTAEHAGIGGLVEPVEDGPTGMTPSEVLQGQLVLKPNFEGAD